MGERRPASFDVKAEDRPVCTRCGKQATFQWPHLVHSPYPDPAGAWCHRCCEDFGAMFDRSTEPWPGGERGGFTAEERARYGSSGWLEAGGSLRPWRPPAQRAAA